MEICQVCAGCLNGEASLSSGRSDRIDTKDFWFEHHASIHSLLESVALGCKFCTSFWRTLSSKEQEALESDTYLCSFRHEDGSAVLRLRLAPIPNSSYFAGWPCGTYLMDINSHALDMIIDSQVYIFRPYSRHYLVPASGALRDRSNLE